MNEFHFFFETFLKLNNFKVFEMEMNENASVCFFARMPEVFSLLERRNGESRSGEKNRFAVNLLSPKDSKKPLEFRETRNPAFQEDLSVVDNENISVNRGRDISDISDTSLPCKHISFSETFLPKASTTLRRSC